ncbi:MAG TPA: hypothetical protein VIM11_18415, partial [Tepidisphaeraceae bacterium]
GTSACPWEAVRKVKMAKMAFQIPTIETVTTSEIRGFRHGASVPSQKLPATFVGGVSFGKSLPRRNSTDVTGIFEDRGSDTLIAAGIVTP